jgi:hypothetical protein
MATAGTPHFFKSGKYSYSPIQFFVEVVTRQTRANLVFSKFGIFGKTRLECLYIKINVFVHEMT